MANVSGGPGSSRVSSPGIFVSFAFCAWACFGVRSYLKLVLAALSLRGGVEKIDSENLGHVSGHVHDVADFFVSACIGYRIGGRAKKWEGKNSHHLDE